MLVLEELQIMSETTIKIGLPKGRMEDGVFSLLREAGIRVTKTSRTYRPKLSLPHFDAKILKPHDIAEMLAIGSRDLGFAGADWVAELNVDLVELLDTELDPVSLVVAAPAELLDSQNGNKLPSRKLLIASEYQRLTEQWIASEGLDASVVVSHGSTEVFPPEDADCIVDNTATGATLRANNLKIIGEIMTSSTRLYASSKAFEDPQKRPQIDELVLLMRSVLDARKRVMLEVNVQAENLESVIEALPCMQEPTVSTLHGQRAYAVKAAVARAELTSVIPEIKRRGGRDIVVSSISQLVP
jgi:ATP phosphoribosyltransferase